MCSVANGSYNRASNIIPVLDLNLLLLIPKALEQLSTATFFLERWPLWCFSTDKNSGRYFEKYNTYETWFVKWTVLCLGPLHAQVSNTRQLTSIFRKHDCVCVLVFLDNILLCNRDGVEQKKDLKVLLYILQIGSLYGKNCKFEIRCSRATVWYKFVACVCLTRVNYILLSAHWGNPILSSVCWAVGGEFYSLKVCSCSTLFSFSVLLEGFVPQQRVIYPRRERFLLAFTILLTREVWQSLICPGYSRQSKFCRPFGVLTL